MGSKICVVMIVVVDAVEVQAAVEIIEIVGMQW